MHFSHIHPHDTEYRSDGLRDFFLYRDLGIADATDGHVVVQLVKANKPPEEGTGWHYHDANYHVVVMLKGWAKFMYETTETLVQAGDVVHQVPGLTHFLFDYSPDMEFLEIVSPANFGTMSIEGPCPVPAAQDWGDTVA